MSTATLNPPVASRAPAVAMVETLTAKIDARLKGTVAANIAIYRAAVQAAAEEKVIAPKQIEALQSAMEPLGFTSADFATDIESWKRLKQMQQSCDAEIGSRRDLEAERLALAPKLEGLLKAYNDARNRLQTIEHLQTSGNAGQTLARFEAANPQLCMADYVPNPHGRIVGTVATQFGMRNLHEDGCVGGLA